MEQSRRGASDPGGQDLNHPISLPADDDGKITWVLVTYDTLTPRRKTFAQVSGGGAGDPECLTAVGAEKALQRVDDKTLKIILEPDDAATLRAAEQVQFPSWLREAERYQAALVRIAGPILAALTAWNPDGVAVDEAHLIKNPDAARTLTVRRHIHDPARPGLLLSGTLIQNYYQTKGLPLLEEVVRLDDHYRRAKRAGVGEAELTRLLPQRYMIRQELKEVEPDFPKKIRERMEIPRGPRGRSTLTSTCHHMARADEIFFQAALEGGSREETKNRGPGVVPGPPPPSASP